MSDVIPSHATTLPAMRLHEITIDIPPECYGEAAHLIKQSFFGAPKTILDSLTTTQVVELWLTGLQEAIQLSELNLSEGREPINYPHLWVKSNLFRRIYPRWVALNEDVNSLMASIECLLSQGKEEERKEGGKKEVATKVAPEREGGKEDAVPSIPVVSALLGQPRPMALGLAKQLGIKPAPVKVKSISGDAYLEQLRKNRAEIASRPKPTLSLSTNDSTDKA